MRYSEPERRWEISDQRHKTEANLRRIQRYLRIQTQCGVVEAVSQSWRLVAKIWLRHEELSNKHRLIPPPQVT